MLRLPHPADLSDSTTATTSAPACCEASGWLDEGPVRIDRVNEKYVVVIEDDWESHVHANDLSTMISRTIAIHQASIAAGVNPSDFGYSTETLQQTNPDLGRELAKLARRFAEQDDTPGRQAISADGVVRVSARGSRISRVDLDPRWAAGRSGSEIAAAVFAVGNLLGADAHL